MYGWAGNDTMFGANGDDYMQGNSGKDRMYGNSGQDTLRGGSGNDYLDGGQDGKHDVVDGQSGYDTAVDYFFSWWYHEDPLTSIEYVIEKPI